MFTPLNDGFITGRTHDILEKLSILHGIVVTVKSRRVQPSTRGIYQSELAAIESPITLRLA